MQELEESLVKMLWLKVTGEPPEETLLALQRLREEQGPFFSWLLADAPEGGWSETALEILLYLAVTVQQVVAWRQIPKGPLKLPLIDDVTLKAQAEKRERSVGACLRGKESQAKPLDEAIEGLVDRFDLPQLALLGHAVEGVLAACEDGDLTRVESEAAFVRLLVFIDLIDRLVKS